MRTILTKYKVNPLTYLFFILSFFCGYFKNVCLIFFIVSLHELGHIFCIKAFRYKIIQVELYPFGGMTRIDKPINSSINKELFISISGILMQLVLQGIMNFLTIKRIVLPNTYQMFTFYNYTIAFFNLLPMYPLDGSRCLNAFLEKIMPYEQAIKWTNRICLLVFLLFTIYNCFSPKKNYTICLFLFVQFFLIVNQQKYLKKRFFLERLLYQFPYQKIESHETLNIHLLKKNTLHFFKYQNRYLHEKGLLKEIFKH